MVSWVYAMRLDTYTVNKYCSCYGIIHWKWIQWKWRSRIHENWNPTEQSTTANDHCSSCNHGNYCTRFCTVVSTIWIISFCCYICTGNGIDFDSTINNVTILPGNNGTFIFIPIIDNNVVEDVENFSLSIQIPSEFLDIGVRVGAISMATGFIINDDGKLFNYYSFVILININCVV